MAPTPAMVPVPQPRLVPAFGGAVDVRPGLWASMRSSAQNLRTDLHDLFFPKVQA